MINIKKLFCESAMLNTQTYKPGANKKICRETLPAFNYHLNITSDKIFLKHKNSKK